MVAELLPVLTPQERDTLRQRIRENDSQLHQFIEAFLNDATITKAALQKKFKINENTYFKNLSLAKDEIYDIIRQHMRTGYDELLLPNLLYRRGLEVHASKLRLKLEKEYERYGWWSALNEIYNLEVVVAYAKCDIKWLEKINKKVEENLPRMVAFISLDKKVVLEMAILEKGELKETALATTEKKLMTLMKGAIDLDHPSLIFNLLHCRYLLYTKFQVDKKKAQQVVDEIAGFVKKYEGRMIDLAKHVALLNQMGFYTQFESETKPDKFFQEIESAIGKFGMLFDAQALLHFCTHFFLIRDNTLFEKYLARFLALPTDRSFAYQTAYAQALQAFLKKDAKAFYNYQNEFYNQGDSREYDGYNLLLRYLEIALLLQEKNELFAFDKLESVTKFLRRNFSKARVEIENEQLEILRCALKKSNKKQATKTPTYRLANFLKMALHDWGLFLPSALERGQGEVAFTAWVYSTPE